MTDQKLPRFQWNSLSYLATRVGRVGTMALGALMEAEGLTRHHFTIVSALQESGAMYQNDLADRANINRGHMVAYLDQLEAHGTLQRTVDPVDRRRRLIELTPDGRRFAARAVEAAREGEEEIYGALDPAQREQLRGLLQLVVAGQGETRA